MDIVGDVMETSGTLSIASASNEKLVSASMRYLDIEESSEVKDLLVQDYVDELQQIEEGDEEEISRRHLETKAKQRCTFKLLAWSTGGVFRDFELH